MAPQGGIGESQGGIPGKGGIGEERLKKGGNGRRVNFTVSLCIIFLHYNSFVASLAQ